MTTMRAAVRAALAAAALAAVLVPGSALAQA
jgi:hypothetical protein